MKLLISLALAAGLAVAAPAAPKSLRVYVFDGGTLGGGDPSRFSLKPEEMAEHDMSIAAYLVVHPRGVLMWDSGALPDRELTKEGTTTRYRIVLPNGNERFVTTTKKLATQLAATGYSPRDVTYLALSHYHYDHTGNANMFAGATWLVRQNERDIMFPDKPNDLTRPETYSALKSSKTTIVKTDDYDVFGDGTVVLKWTPGHTPGHQVLFLKLAKTGPLVISGDLYHYPEERRLHRVPTFDADPKQTAASRASLDVFMQKAGAQLWIQHDLAANRKLKKAPEFYE
ncbi:MAG TPA: N-acyl homoserine lactonase family protein [Vicinamibacterales bacterium]|nr:N-acyl homoserine lactonase family protein [Vicinamibacterales bacterium]